MRHDHQILGGRQLPLDQFKLLRLSSDKKLMKENVILVLPLMEIVHIELPHEG